MLDERGYLVSKQNRSVDKLSTISRVTLKPVEFLSDVALANIPPGELFVFDAEIYINFFYVAFKHLKSGKYVAFEKSADHELNCEKLRWMMYRYCLVSFNGINFDIPLLTLALKGASCQELKQACNFIIQNQTKPFQFEAEYKLKLQKYNHIDLIEVAPLQGSLKLYGGRLHCKRMQDLPFAPEHTLTQADAEIIRLYCCNDLDLTEELFNELSKEIKLRIEMSEQYGVDLKSKSDAQIAEAVINSEMQKALGYYPRKPKEVIHSVKFNKPDFIKFDSPHLNDVLDSICNATFELNGLGSPIWPIGLGELEKTTSGFVWVLKAKINGVPYKLGMGGLHSMEHMAAHVADVNTIIAEDDVASFYPRIILNQGLYPKHLGPDFLIVYEAIVDRRLDAKGKAAALKATDRIAAAGFKAIADSLKIVINGSFGKLGNKWSTLYAPQLMLQVTLTGQLSLLMLIEQLNAEGIETISANTDGVVSKYNKNRIKDVRRIISKWESQTCFKTEETRYKALYSRDVNNYIALTESGGIKDASFYDERLGCKTKGTYSERGSALNSILSKNPETLVCTDAVLNYVTNGVSVETTIRECTDVRRFLMVRNVKGGGEKNNEYLGKVVRWYFPKAETGCISYVGSGNKVANTEGAKPLMDLPDTLPTDINYGKYIEQSIDMLYDCGALVKPTSGLLF